MLPMHFVPIVRDRMTQVHSMISLPPTLREKHAKDGLDKREGSIESQ